MARSKAKKNGSKKGKTPSKEAKEETVESSGTKKFGPFAGIAAVAIVIIAILFRPQHQPNDATTATVVENLTVDGAEWVPVDAPASSEKVTAEPPAEPEPITKGFSLAAFHNVDENPVKKEDLIHYLRYDDGYTVCLKKEDTEFDEYGVWELKKAKLKYLEYIANDAAHWIAESPLSREATCRVLTLTHEDHAGVDKFMNVMKQNDETEIMSFSLDKQNNASEFRTIVCLSRLVDLMVDQAFTPEFQNLRSTWSQEGMKAKEATEAEPPRMISYGWNAKPDKSSAFHYYENGPFSSWIRPTVRPGEKGTFPLGKKEKKASLVVRKNPCPVQASMALI